MWTDPETDNSDFLTVTSVTEDSANRTCIKSTVVTSGLKINILGVKYDHVTYHDKGTIRT